LIWCYSADPKGIPNASIHKLTQSAAVYLASRCSDSLFICDRKHWLPSRPTKDVHPSSFGWLCTPDIACCRQATRHCDVPIPIAFAHGQPYMDSFKLSSCHCPIRACRTTRPDVTAAHSHGLSAWIQVILSRGSQPPNPDVLITLYSHRHNCRHN
jgi:hypothetical protein